MSFLSPLPAAGGTALLNSPLGLCLASPAPEKRCFAVPEGRLSLEHLLDEASGSRNSSQEEALDVFAPGAKPACLPKASSSKQLDAFATLPPPVPQPRVMDVDPTMHLEAAADSLTAKLQEQLMPWLKQQVHEVLVGAKGAVDLQSELAGVNAKLQAALRGEDIATRAASSIAEALPSMLAKHLRDSQEVSVEGSICAPTTQENGSQPNGQAKMASTSGATNSTSAMDDEAEQQATSALKPLAQVARTSSMEVDEEQQQEAQEEEEERPGKRMCLAVPVEAAAPAPAAAPAATHASPPARAEMPSTLDLTPAFGSGGFGTSKKRRTHYVKMRELETSIQEAQVVAQHLQQAVRNAELQHAAIMEENQQLWNAVAHINATLHAGRASLLAAALQAAAPQQLLAEPAAPAAKPAEASGAAGGPSPDLADMFGSSPDPMCLAEACGMLFSPAPAKLPKEVPVNKPRKLFEDEMQCCVAGAGAPGLPLLDDLPMPKLELSH